MRNYASSGSEDDCDFSVVVDKPIFQSLMTVDLSAAVGENSSFAELSKDSLGHLLSYLDNNSFFRLRSTNRALYERLTENTTPEQNKRIDSYRAYANLLLAVSCGALRLDNKTFFRLRKMNRFLYRELTKHATSRQLARLRDYHHRSFAYDDDVAELYIRCWEKLILRNLGATYTNPQLNFNTLSYYRYAPEIQELGGLQPFIDCGLELERNSLSDKYIALVTSNRRCGLKWFASESIRLAAQGGVMAWQIYNLCVRPSHVSDICEKGVYIQTERVYTTGNVDTFGLLYGVITPLLPAASIIIRCSALCKVAPLKRSLRDNLRRHNLAIGIGGTLLAGGYSALTYYAFSGKIIHFTEYISDAVYLNFTRSAAAASKCCTLFLDGMFEESCRSFYGGFGPVAIGNLAYQSATAFHFIPSILISYFIAWQFALFNYF